MARTRQLPHGRVIHNSANWSASSFYAAIDILGIMETMKNDFDQFVEELGPDAKLYTPAELRRLWVEVQMIAESLLRWHRRRQRDGRSNPQCDLDDPSDDRTLKR